MITETPSASTNLSLKDLANAHKTDSDPLKDKIEETPTSSRLFLLLAFAVINLMAGKKLFNLVRVTLPFDHFVTGPSACLKPPRLSSEPGMRRNQKANSTWEFHSQVCGLSIDKGEEKHQGEIKKSSKITSFSYAPKATLQHCDKRSTWKRKRILRPSIGAILQSSSLYSFLDPERPFA